MNTRREILKHQTSSLPPFGIHVITFIGFLYASAFGGTLSLLGSVNSTESIFILLLFWFFIAQDWLLKYQAWDKIEMIPSGNGVPKSSAKKISENTKSQSYYASSIFNFIIIVTFLISLTISFIFYLNNGSSFLGKYSALPFGLALIFTWIWSWRIGIKYLGKENFSEENESIVDIYLRCMTLKAHELKFVQKWKGEDRDGFKWYEKIAIHYFLIITIILKPWYGLAIVLISLIGIPNQEILFVWAFAYLVAQFISDSIILFNLPRILR